MLRPLTVLLTAASLAGCSDDPEPQHIDRATFVAAYTDLRLAARDDRFDDGVRDSILDAHGISEEELRTFVDAHAADPTVLSEAWKAVTERMAAIDSAAADTLSADSIEGGARPDSAPAATATDRDGGRARRFD